MAKNDQKVQKSPWSDLKQAKVSTVNPYFLSKNNIISHFPGHGRHGGVPGPHFLVFWGIICKNFSTSSAERWIYLPVYWEVRRQTL